MSTYQPGIPTGTVKFNQDYLNVQKNFQQLETSFGKNHIPLSVTANNGKHTFIEMVNNAGIPAGLSAAEGTLYTKAATGSQLFYSPDASTNEYKMTNVLASKFSTFGTSTPYATGMLGGWTFLPGGMILNYGFKSNPVDGDTITYARPYPAGSNMFITITAQRSNTADKVMSVLQGSEMLTEFKLILSGTSPPTGIWWQVIGTG